MAARLLVFILVLAAAAGGRAHVGAAEDEGFGTSYLTPFPAGDVYTLAVIGDDLANGLLDGLLEAFAGDSRLQIRTKHYFINGLMRPDFQEKLQSLDEDLQKEPIHIAIVMLGAWDRASVKDSSGKRAQVGSQPWRAEYASRGDRLMKLLKKNNAAVYWVGLPNVRRYEANQDAQMMNDIIRERIYLNGVKYIDAHAGFIDETGGYSPYGPDITGKIRLLREGDGVYFTTAGNRKLAHFVERDLRRDLTQAKADRSIPLAGGETEQAKINPEKAKLAAPASGPVATGAQTKSAQPGGPGSPATTAGSQSAAPTTGEQKADNGKISFKGVNPAGREEVVTLDIVRPAIPASVVALVTRRESPDRPSQMGEVLVDQIAGGLSLMSTVAPANAAGTIGGRRGLSPAQSPYFRVLFKGERLAPKRGRADDMSWPRGKAPAEATSGDSEPLETGTAPKSAPDKEQPRAGAPRR